VSPPVIRLASNVCISGIPWESSQLVCELMCQAVAPTRNRKMGSSYNNNINNMYYLSSTILFEPFTSALLKLAHLASSGAKLPPGSGRLKFVTAIPRVANHLTLPCHFGSPELMQL
jgi:hypothetical protein